MKREQKSDISGNHGISIENRESVTLYGIDDVLSYDEDSVVMQSIMGQLTIEGEGLNIIKLNLTDGELCITGRVTALYYMEQQKNGGFLSRLFK